MAAKARTTGEFGMSDNILKLLTDFNEHSFSEAGTGCSTEEFVPTDQHSRFPHQGEGIDDIREITKKSKAIHSGKAVTGHNTESFKPLSRQDAILAHHLDGEERPDRWPFVSATRRNVYISADTSGLPKARESQKRNVGNETPSSDSAYTPNPNDK